MLDCKLNETLKNDYDLEQNLESSR